MKDEDVKIVDTCPKCGKKIMSLYQDQFTWNWEAHEKKHEKEEQEERERQKKQEVEK